MLAAAVALSYVPAAIFAGGAVYLAYNGMDGWGWCIVAAIFCPRATLEITRRRDSPTTLQRD